MSRTTQLIACLGIAIGCCAMTSCSDEERLELSEATMEGTLTYKGKPVPFALVIVASAEGGSATANADANGKFNVEFVPLGSVQIGVNSAAGQGLMMSASMAAANGAGPKPPKFVSVPEKYFEPSTSGITTTIADGPNTFDIALQ